MPPVAKKLLAIFGFGPMAGMAWARFSRKRLMAMAVISAVMFVPFLRTGLYATSSTPTPTRAQTIMAITTAAQAGSPAAVISGTVKMSV